MFQHERWKPPQWLDPIYLVRGGSYSYDCATQDSDQDLYGICIPPLDVMMPYPIDYLPGFDQKPVEFNDYRVSHMNIGDIEYDVTIYSIVRFMKLVSDGNPNLIDILFAPDDCILNLTPVGQMLRDNRRLFLSKQLYKRFYCYADEQMRELVNRLGDMNILFVRQVEDACGVDHSVTIDTVDLSKISDSYRDEYVRSYRYGLEKTKRFQNRKQYGYDTKFLSHSVRLALECEQLLRDGDVDLKAHGSLLLDIRKGRMGLSECKDLIDQKKVVMDELIETTNLPDCVDLVWVRQFMFELIDTYHWRR